MIDYSGFRFAKPGKKKREPVKTMRSGRQVCDLKTSAGKKEYKARLTLAWTKQKGRCALCGLPVALEEATNDHRVPRGLGGGSRDDRIENLQAAHLICNTQKGSKRIA